MTRDEVNKLALDKILSVQVTILQLSTGVGKSKIAIDCVNKLYKDNLSINILVPTKAMFKNWEDELTKWNCKVDSNNICIKCYNSITKINVNADVTILDEGHHLSESRRETLIDILSANPKMKLIVLSATLDMDLLYFYKSLGTYNVVKCSIVDAIDGDVLPTPLIYKIPMELNNTIPNNEFIENPRGNNSITCLYKERRAYKRRFPSRKLIIKCTEREYYNHMSDKIEWYKHKFMITRTEIMKNKWLREAKLRLEWLAERKNPIIKVLSTTLQEQRYIIFCANIKQSEELCENSITSKSKNSLKLLDDFNNNKINHIATCNMLNEGLNLSNCKVGIFANLNGSDRIGVQRTGRILRHKKPILIIPYYKETRDAEIVKKLLEDYDTSMIHIVNNIKNIII